MTEWILSSSILILIVIGLRTVFKGKISLRLQYAIWCLVLVRLLIPVSFGSTDISVANLTAKAETPNIVIQTAKPNENVQAKHPVQHPQEQLNEIPSQNNTQNEPMEEKSGFNLSAYAVYIAWGIGFFFVAGMFLLTNLRFKHKIMVSRYGLDVQKNNLEVYATGEIDTPCLFGIKNPAIYVTYPVADNQTLLRHTLEHEATHHRHGDHIWAVLRCLCLAIHWYNPLVWWAAFLSQRDAELACDEATINRLGEGERAEYGRTLIGMTCQKKANVLITATTMNSGKSGLKERIMLIAKKPKMAIYTLITVVLIASIAVGCTFTGAKMDIPETGTEAGKANGDILDSDGNVIKSTDSKEANGDILDSEGNVIKSTGPDNNWGISIEPEGISRTGATAIFVYPNVLPGYENAELTYGDFLALERLENGKWVEVEELPGYEYFVGDSSYPVTDGYGMVHEWELRFGELPDGHYRLGKLVTLKMSDGTTEERIIYGEFFLPDSILSGPVPLEELPEKYSGEQAMIDGCFVQSDGVARENKEIFHQFAVVTQGGVPSFIRIVNWYYGDNPHYTAYDLEYDGSMYTITWLEDGQRYSRQYKYLKHFTGEKERDNMAYDAYEHYVLVNDDQVTWNDIWENLISSAEPASIEHMTVYSDYIYYPDATNILDNLVQIDLEFEGEVLVTTTDFDRIEKIYLLFDGAELLGYEPKTHSIGVGLNLILTSQSGETMTIELDPDGDICRINGEYVFYGAYDEPDYIEKLWYYLGIDSWPDEVYEKCSNAYRPYSVG